MRRRLTVASTVAAAMALAAGCGTAATENLFSLPLDCTPGADCFVQKYVDVDPGPAAVDFRCGHLTSDDHDGTDFRVRPGAEVSVLAPADGRVLRVRDGEPDRRFAEPIDVPADRACGNGVVLDHGDLQSMLCHLAEGSLAVEPGDTVRRGDVIGRVGSSGFADFHHVHLQVMQDGTVLDPYTGVAQSTLACSVSGIGDATDAMWSPEVAAALAAAPPVFVVGAGFHTGPVTIAMVEEAGTVAPGGGTIDGGAEALVAYGLAAGVNTGDELRVVVDGPDVAIDNAVPLKRNRAQELRFAGKRYAGGLPAGTYRMRFEVSRAGAVLDSATAVLTVR